MNILKLNQNFKSKTADKSNQPSGLTSTLLKYERQIVDIEMVVYSSYRQNLGVAVKQIAKLWKDLTPELEDAVVARIHIIDARVFYYKEELIDMKIKPEIDFVKAVFF